MQITIEDNQFIYIYLKEQSKNKENVVGSPEYQCHMIFDDVENWVGLKIINIDIDGNITELPKLGEVDSPLNSSIIEDDDSIMILFNKSSNICKEIEETCNLDIHPTGIFGIELILYSTRIKGRAFVKPFIIKDI